MADTFKTLSVKIKGVSPIILHNGKLADPTYSYTKALKSLTTQFKRNKTDEFYIQHAALEWRGSLYLNAKDQIIVPTDLLLACLIKAGKRQRQGDLVKVGCFVENDAVLEYSGPKELDKLYEVDAFRDVRMVVVNKARVSRCRPRFDDWGLSFTMTYDSEQLKQSEIEGLLNAAGRYCGLGDNRPMYGRFEVVSVKEV